MTGQQQLDYQRIATTIEYLQAHHLQQPSLDQLAANVHLSPFHFQRLFHTWAGTTPKKFLQYISLQHAKSILKNTQPSLFDTAAATGLSGTSRLHDLFVSLEGMTPAQYKDGGSHLTIHYSLADSPFGNIFIASTEKGICRLVFSHDETSAVQELISQFPHATLHKKTDRHQQNALLIFQHDWSQLSKIKLHLKATDFQLKVWEALLKIPPGQLVTYGTIAGQAGHKNASRAAGAAIGSNPVAFLIPCHRVITSTGLLGGYRWGTTRKSAIIGWESARTLHLPQ